MLTHTADHLQKIWLERASTHEKSINVRLFDQVSAISRVDGSAVNYDGGGSSGAGVLVDEKFSDFRMHLLRLCRIRGAPSPDCPHRFLSEHNVVQLWGCNAGQSDLELVRHHLHCLVCFAVFQGFAEA